MLDLCVESLSQVGATEQRLHEIPDCVGFCQLARRRFSSFVRRALYTLATKERASKEASLVSRRSSRSRGSALPRSAAGQKLSPAPIGKLPGMSIVQSRPDTTCLGGVTGKGFTPGVSGNPGGRPKGLSRRVREFVGDDGHEIAEFMFSVMNDERARTADRIEAAKWLADRGFGKAPLVVSAGVTAEHLLQDYFSKLSLEDLQAMQAILGKYSHDPEDVASPREFEGSQDKPLPLGRGSRSSATRSPDHNDTESRTTG